MFLRVELIARSWSLFSRKRAQRPMDRKIFALRAPKEFGLRPPGSGDPFSNAHPRHAGGGSRHPVVSGKRESASVQHMIMMRASLFDPTDCRSQSK